ncbi:MAG: sulfatase-like hydrolase/transferase [Candidatus Latescibacterota bacterium]
MTLGDSFRHAGYATGLIGKWHNGALDDRFHPNRRGFDDFVGFRGGWMDYWDWWIERSSALQRNGTRTWSDGRYLTDVFTEEAVEFLRRHRSEPFLLTLCYNAPHSPLQAPDEVVEPYLERGIPRGAAITYAMDEVVDAGIAKLLEELHTLGLAQDTIVMFTSDNGPAMRLRADQVPEGMSLDVSRGNAGFRGAKGSVYVRGRHPGTDGDPLASGSRRRAYRGRARALHRLAADAAGYGRRRAAWRHAPGRRRRAAPAARRDTCRGAAPVLAVERLFTRRRLQRRHA